MDTEYDYHEVITKRVGPAWVVASSQDSIALADQDGEISIIGETEQSFTAGDPVTDIAIARYVFVLSGDEITAYTHSGVELWQTDVASAEQLVTLSRADTLGVLTGDGMLRGLDTETGTELFQIDRPHDEFADPIAVGGEQALYLAAWSFVVCVDKTGTVTLDENLDTTIEDIGILNERLVVSLKNGMVCGIDPETGTKQWETTAAVRTLAPTGGDAVFGVTDTEVVSISADGGLQSVPLPAQAPICSSADAAVVAINEGTTATVFRHGPAAADMLAIEPLTNQVGRNSPLRLYIENTGSKAVETTLRFESERDMTAETTRHELSLDPGESKEVAYRFRDLPNAPDLSYEVLAGAQTAVAETVQVERALNPEEDIETDATLTRVSDGNLITTATVENTSGRTLGRVELGEDVVESLPPGEKLQTELTQSTENERPVETASVSHRGESACIDVPQPTPDAIVSVELSHHQSGIYRHVDCVVTPAVDAPVAGDLSIQIADEPLVERQVDLGPDSTFECLLVIPPAAASNDVSVTVDGTLLDSPVTKIVPGDDSGQTAVSKQPAVGTNRSTSVTVTRDITSPALRSSFVRESVRIRNNGETPTTISVADTFGSYEVGSVESGETRTLKRGHTFLETGEFQLPALTGADGSELAPPESVTVTDQPVECRATVVRESTTVVAIELLNNSEQPCQLRKVALAPQFHRTAKAVTWDPPESSAAHPSETVSVEWPLDDVRLEGAEKCLVGVQYEQPAGELTKLSTLAPVTAASADHPHQNGTVVNDDRGLLSAILTDRSQLIADRHSIFEVELTNQTNEPLRNLSITTTGDAILETPLSPSEKTVTELQPNDTTVLMADVNPGTVETTTITVEVEGQYGGDTFETSIRFTGPVADSTESWEENEYYTSWMDQSAAATDSQQTTPETKDTHLVTPFQPTGEGNHR